jgi:tRNA A-37 threonylcarbamoyl transferase component Bud32
MPDEPSSGWVVVHPRYRRRFARWNLTDPRTILDLPGEVVSGHPDRHVVRVVVGRDLERFVAFLKREHRVPWRDRLTNLLFGFGWASKSEREARLLEQLRCARIPVPRWLAFGEDGRGRAFLLVRALPNTVDLRTFLHRESRLRRRGLRYRQWDLARRLGRLLARVHSAGFNCPDLWSKHVLIHRRRRTLALIDWQRSRRRAAVPWSARARDLAALHASLADDLASPRERLTFLREYHKVFSPVPDRSECRCFVAAVQRRAAHLLGRRFVREMRRPPLSGRAQRLRWVDGEALCVVRSFWRRCGGQLPDWLTTAARTPVTRDREDAIVVEGRRLILRRFPPAIVVRRWLARLLGRRFTSPGLHQSSRVFRLERFGVPGPRLLAFGQRADGAGFVLFEPPHNTIPLTDWLAAPRPDRLEVLQATEALLRRLHDAGYCLTEALNALHVRRRAGRWSPILTDVQSLRECRVARATEPLSPPQVRQADQTAGGTAPHV